MAEYIERGRLQTAIQKGCKPWGYDSYRYVMGWSDCLTRVRDTVCKVPAADVAPQVHGQWIRPHWKNSDYCCDCSKCGGEAMHREYQWSKKGIYPICPNCGAKMDGGADNAKSV